MYYHQATTTPAIRAGIGSTLVGAAGAVASGIPGEVGASEEEQAIASTLEHIDNGTTSAWARPFKWGSPFRNDQLRLPTDTTYREYDVPRPPGVTHGAGARRIVAGANGKL